MWTGVAGDIGFGEGLKRIEITMPETTQMDQFSHYLRLFWLDVLGR
jgi:hypothetical protein